MEKARFFTLLILIGLILAGCDEPAEDTLVSSVITKTSTQPLIPTSTITQKPSPTFTPTLIPTPTIIPTVKLPVQENTPFPYSDELITVDNILQVETLAKWGKGFIDSSVHFPNLDCFLVTTGDSVILYDSNTLEEIRSTQVSFNGMLGNVVMTSKEIILFLISPNQGSVWTSQNRNLEIVKWDIETNQTETIYDYSDLPCYINNRTRISPGGKELICDDDKGHFYLLNIQNPEEYFELDTPGSGTVVMPSFEFTPDGTKLLMFWFLSEYNTTTYQRMLVWDTSNLEILASTSIQGDRYVINPDSQSFALYLDDQGKVQFYSIESLEKIGEINTGIINSDYGNYNPSKLNYSNDGDYFVMSSNDNEISVWDIFSGEKISVLNDLKYSPDEWHEILYVPDVINYLPLEYDRFHNLVNVFFLGSNKNIVALTKNHKMINWNIENNGVDAQTTSQAHIYTDPILLENEHLIAFGDEEGRIQAWDLSINQLAWEILHEKRILWLINDENNQRIIFGDGYAEYAIDLTNQEVMSISTNRAGKVVMSPDHTLIAGYRSGKILLLDIDRLDVSCEIASQNPQYMIFSPDGNFFVTGVYDAVVWDTFNCKKLTSIRFGELIFNLSFSEDGEYFMITKNDFFDPSQPISFKMWKTDSWTLYNEEIIQQENPVWRSVRFTNCGDYILLPDGLYHLGAWETPLLEYDPIYYLLPCRQKFIIRSRSGYIELLGIR